MNVIDPILFHCRYEPEALAICVPGADIVTYARLEQTINNIGRRALSLGLIPGNTVALFVPERPAFHAALILGLAKVGIVTASIGRRPLPQTVNFDAILSDGPHPFSGIKTALLDASWVEGDGTPPVLNHVPQGGDMCRIVLTSGTTGEAKAVALTHDMILGRILRYYTVFGNRVPLNARFFCDMTLTTSIGYTFLIYALCKGGTFFARGINAETTLRALGFYKIESMIAAPAGLAEFAGDYDAYRCQHIFDSIIVTGSLLSKTLADNIRGRMGATVISGYGSTEMGQVANAPAHMIGHVTGAVGYVAPGMMVEIVDKSGRKCGVEVEGLVRIRGDYMANGYIGAAQESQQFFRDGWFYPGDNGCLTRNGLLVISGREKTILNLGGEKVRPELIEEVLASGGLQAGAFLVANDLGADEIWVAIESQSVDETKLRIHCQKSLPAIFMPKRFVAVPKLPRNDMGKLDRKRLAEIVGAR